MASIVPRPKKDGTTYQIKWRQDGTWQTENFADEDSAKEFRRIVEAHGNRWPPGWVRGKGFVQEPSHPDDVPFTKWAERYIQRLNKVDDRTRSDYLRELRLHLSLLRHTDLHGNVSPATICNITQDDVNDWVRREMEGERNPAKSGKWRRRPASPKSIANRHGLLYSIVQAAVDTEPPLRSSNCCKRTDLPRVDEHTAEEMVFLEHDEYQLIHDRFTNDAARDLADLLVGTGLRWSEATALQVRDLNRRTRTISVQRAWKQAEGGAVEPFFLGPPKTKQARRQVRLSPSLFQMLLRLQEGKAPEDPLFLTSSGAVWRHWNFQSNFWTPAIEAATGAGLTKRPRIHDLRHTQASWLIAARITPKAIQERLGHKSIITTMDRYGHLLREADDEIAAAVEDAMAPPDAGGNVVRMPASS